MLFCIERICNDAGRAKTRFYVPHSVEHCTSACSRAPSTSQPAPHLHRKRMTDSLLQALALLQDADPGLVQTVALSLRVSASACLVGAVVGLSVGAWLAWVRFPGQGLLVGLLNTLLALPSVVVGLAVYLLLSRAGPLGAWGILFTPTAMVVAQSVLVVPLIAALSRRLLLDALAEGGDQLRSLGASPWQCAALMLLHERLAVLTILLTAFGRAIAEVGAVMIVGGNIAGVTRVMTTAIALQTSQGDLPLALALGAVLLAVVGLLHGALALMGRLAGPRVRFQGP
jgi:ABC-type tungstate transport system substrate-binding protein